MWPVLVAERAFYELALGGSVAGRVNTLEAWAGPELILPEQVWDQAPLPDVGLETGRATSDALDEGYELFPVLKSMADRAADKFRAYSHGMRQRLGIAAALLRAPRLLLLDEPTTGLDPAGMRDMRALVRRLADSGMTVVLSSHLLGEVEELCDRVAIIRTGRVVYEGTIAELKRTATGAYRLRTTDDARALDVCRSQQAIVNPRRSAGAINFNADEPTVARLSAALVEAGAPPVELTPQAASLETLFFRLTEGQDGAEPVGEALPVRELA